MLRPCTGCHGVKEVIGMGNMLQKCPMCHGIGYIDSGIEKKSVELCSQVNGKDIETPILIKKRGRPKKVA